MELRAEIRVIDEGVGVAMGAAFAIPGGGKSLKALRVPWYKPVPDPSLLVYDLVAPIPSDWASGIP